MSEHTSSLEIGPTEIIIIDDPQNALTDDLFDELLTSLHERFPNNLVMVMGPGQSLQTMSEEEARNILQAIVDHQELREHKKLTGA